MAYTTESAVRAMNILFDSSNIPTASITQFIGEAENEINSSLGLATSMSDADAIKCNVANAANLYCSIRCCLYDADIFNDLATQKSLVSLYTTEYKNAIKTLKTYKGKAYEPVGFTMSSSADLQEFTWGSY